MKIYVSLYDMHNQLYASRRFDVKHANDISDAVEAMTLDYMLFVGDSIKITKCEEECEDRYENENCII